MKKFLLISIIATTFAISSCSKDQDNTITPPPPTSNDTAQGSVEIIIKDTVGFKGLDSVKVTIFPENRFAYTENGGFAFFDSVNLGQHRITLEKHDYNYVDTTFTVIDSIGMNYAGFYMYLLVSNWDYFTGLISENQGRSITVLKNGSILSTQRYINRLGNYIYKSGSNSWTSILSDEGVCRYQESPYTNCLIATSSRTEDGQGGFISTPDLHVSYDNGATWAEKIQSFDIVNLAFCQNGIIYAVGRYGSWNSDIWRCYKSIDNGNSWNQADPINGVRYFFANTLANNRIIIGNYNEDTIYVSDNSGVNWNSRPVTFQESYLYRACKVLPNGNLIVKDYEQNRYVLKMSNNNGSSWYTVETNPSNLINDSTSNIVIASNGNLYLTKNSQVDHDVFASLDQGANWTRIGHGLPIKRIPYGLGIDLAGNLFTVVEEYGNYANTKIYKNKFVFPH